MSILDRLISSTTPESSDKLPVHQFAAAIVAATDGTISRADIESGFNISTTGQESLEMDFLIGTYTGIVSDDFSAVGNAAIRAALEGLSVSIKQRRYLDTLHAIFMLTEKPGFEAFFTQAELKTWLQNSVA